MNARLIAELSDGFLAKSQWKRKTAKDSEDVVVMFYQLDHTVLGGKKSVVSHFSSLSGADSTSGADASLSANSVMPPSRRRLYQVRSFLMSDV